MNWASHGFLILSKFWIGYGAGFSVLGFADIGTAESSFTVFSIIVYPCVSGLIMVFPQLGKTFSEASNEAKRR